MNCEELYAILQKMNRAEREATRVVLATDAEGNGFAPLWEAEHHDAGEIELTSGVYRRRGREAEKVKDAPTLLVWPT